MSQDTGEPAQEAMSKVQRVMHEICKLLEDNEVSGTIGLHAGPYSQGAVRIESADLKKSMWRNVTQMQRETKLIYCMNHMAKALESATADWFEHILKTQAEVGVDVPLIRKLLKRHTAKLSQMAHGNGNYDSEGMLLSAAPVGGGPDTQ